MVAHQFGFRYSPEKVDTAILTAIKKNPGIWYAQLYAVLAEGPLQLSSKATLSRRLQLLIEEETITFSRNGYRKQFYLPSHVQAQTLTERLHEAIETYYRENETGITKKELMERVNLKEHTVRYNLEKIQERLVISNRGHAKCYAPAKK